MAKYIDVHNDLVSRGAFPGLPTPKGLIDGPANDREIAETSTCEDCGHVGMNFKTYTDNEGNYRAALAICPRCNTAIEF